ncbi:Sphingosine kinase 1 [Trichoplax sp. H2]|uniref:DAGKc domain-containing protein n=1 Tax=Trichoplax adhaerens TaxID=10228 RepID=B3RJ69_TRIAD|nr:hypothetical protein TRIADDRAFT_51430 [Trichoplax adhaerens]EDV29279.1 hypothetical protein TRIADDRAFT_51430 [Trichoplax adhaerens]RDD39249.1 Sphingosine kinase 1 [Trichoplax sp. H2]|eukprot:XP_002108481.1 hypothetical protein TRIADDRAFT_51430 [Trichoplax adhaerens]
MEEIRISNKSTTLISQIIMQDTLQLIWPRNKLRPCHVVLTQNQMCIKVSDSGPPASLLGDDGVIQLKDVIGCKVSRGTSTKRRDRGGYLTLFWYPMRKKKIGSACKRISIPVYLRVAQSKEVEDNIKIADQWHAAIICALRGIKYQPDLGSKSCPAPRKLLVFINPCSGSGKASKIFNGKSKDILNEADILCEVVTTERVGHAKDYIINANLSKWDGILVVSGDGLIYEVINGLNERQDWDTVRHMPIGILPAGSGNALYASIMKFSGEPNDIVSATFIIAKYSTRPLDLMHLQSKKNNFLAFLSIGWGMIADIDIKSEKFHFLGSNRFTVEAVSMIAKRKVYRGKISYLPCDKEPEETRESQWTNNGNVSERSAVMDETFNFHNDDDMNVTQLDANHQQSAILTVGDDSNPIPSLDKPLPNQWKVIDQDFITVVIGNLPYLSTDFLFAPPSRLDDGKAYIVAVSDKVNRKGLTKILLSTKNGQYIESPDVQLIPCKAFRLVPETEGGYLTVDGEVVDYGPIQGTVEKGGLQVFCL